MPHRRLPASLPVIVSVLAPALALFVAACAGTPTAPSDPPTAVVDYTCSNHVALNVKWWPKDIQATYGDQVWVLPLARSGSGARYADKDHEVWEHQGTVRVTDGPYPPVECTKAGK